MILGFITHYYREDILRIKAIVLIACLASGCSTTFNKSRYDQLKQYNGTYEYLHGATLELSASDYDTTLYAILDDAKYPLKFLSADTFQNPQKEPVIFRRNSDGEVNAYETGGRVFRLINKAISPAEWFPRRKLASSPNQYQYEVPRNLDDGIVTGSVHETFSNPDVLADMVRETIKGEYRDVHSMLIWKDGKLVVEEYFYGYDQSKPHQLRSASKSFIGTLVGIAIDEGKISNEDEPLLPLFKNIYPQIANTDSRKHQITIRDFLTYRHGMDCNDEDPATAGHESKMIESPDWVKFTLDLPMKEDPGKRSSYCTGCAQTLGRMVELVTGEPLVEFADQRLFQPMGISEYHWRFSPDTSSRGTFNQMYLRPRDMLKLAIMYFDHGKWRGKQIVSAKWIDRTFARNDIEFGYLWRHKSFEVSGRVYQSYLATGNGGQKINIWPELNMITVFTGGNYNAYLYGKTTPPNEMIPKYILRAL